ncbi:MAG: AAA family ATPase [Planctomycetaceae bacterium]
MLRRLVLENFMSHRHTVIDLADGLTVLTGPNNCGKSAVVAALQILASNGKTTHVMRHGADTCRITVETDDGHVICWQRKKSTVTYTLDGEEIGRVGQGVPDRLHDLLRLPIVETESGKSQHSYDIHFGEQKSPIFLLGEAGSRAASFFAAASDAAKLLEMSGRHRTNAREARANTKRLTAELEQCEAELRRLDLVDDLEDRIERADKLHEAITLSISEAVKARKYRHDLQQAATSCDGLRAVDDCLQQLSQPPVQHDVAAVRSLVAGLQQTQSRKNEAAAADAACRNLISPPILEDSGRCSFLLTEMTRLESAILENSRQVTQLAPLQPPPALQSIEELQWSIEQLQILQPKITELSRQQEALQPLKAPQLPNDAGPLRRLIADLQRLETAVTDQRSLHARLAPLTAPDSIQDTSSLRRLIEELRRATRVRSAAGMVADQLQHLQPPSEDQDSDQLNETICELQAAEHQVQTLQRHFQNARQDQQTCEQQLRDFVRQHPRCGTCGAELNPERLMLLASEAQEHTHE